MDETLVRLLRDLVRIDSRNLRSLHLDGPRESDEEGMCAYLRAHLEGLGFTVDVSHVAPRRPNLVACLGTDRSQATLAFQAHMDTVGVDGMTHDPFAGDLRNGRLYGRGAADCKGGMAAMLTALARLRAEALPLNLMFVGTCAEETGCEGAPFLDLSPYHVTGMIVGEPTSNQPIVAHKGHAWVDLVCTGRAAHGARPEAGENAIYRMLDVVQFLRGTMIPELAAHEAPGFSGSTLAVTMIQGGTKVNIIPDRCRVSLDMRLVPRPQAVEALLDELVRRLAEATGVTVQLENVHSSPGFGIAPEAPLVQALCEGIRSQGGNPALGTVSYCTDGGVFAAGGCPTVVFGPGSILQAHGPEEYIDMAEVASAVDILVATAHAFPRRR